MDPGAEEGGREPVGDAAVKAQLGVLKFIENGGMQSKVNDVCKFVGSFFFTHTQVC